MMSRFKYYLLTAVTAILVSSFPHTSADTPVVTLKMATMAPEGSIWMQEIDALKGDLEVEAGGKIKIKIYPGGIMGDDDVVLRKIRVGQLDGALFTTNALCKLNDDLFVLSYPGIFGTADEVDHYLTSQADRLSTSLHSKDFEMLGMMSLGFTYAFSSVPIRTIDDMKQAKVWLWDNDPVMNSMYSHLGVTPVSVGIGDVMTALQTGLLNTVFNTPTGIVSLQWFTRVQQMIDLPLTHSFGAFVLKTKSWDKIPEDLRPVLTALVKKHALEITRKTRLEDQKARDLISVKGVSIIAPEPDLQASLREIFADVAIDLQKQAANPEFYQILQNTQAEFRSKKTE